MSAVVLFDGYVEGDAALDNSHWIAERTRERLGDQALVLLDQRRPLAEQLAALTTKTTLNLFEGVRDEATLKESVQTAIDDLSEWFESNEGEAWADQQPSYIEIAGLIGFAQQLKREMVVRCAVNERSR